MNLKGAQKNSKYWRCSDYLCKGMQTYQPEWFYVGDVPAELVEMVYRPPVVVDLQARAPQCPRCGGQMKLRSTRNGSSDFWGCMSYPTCKGTRNVIDVLDAQMEEKAVTKVPSTKVPGVKAPNTKASPMLLLDDPEIVELIKYSITVLGNEKAAVKWLAKPNIYQLEGESPFAVLTSAAGRKKVRAMLDTLYD